MSWTDSRLTWNPNHYGGIRYRVWWKLSHQSTNSCSSSIKVRSRSMHLSPDLIWHPKFSVINRLNEFSAVDEVLNQAEINYEGVVKWARNIRVKTDCEMNIVDFPYDSQSCPITISSQDNSNEFLKMSTRKWNRLNDVDENDISVSPTDINTIKVSNIQYIRNIVFKCTDVRAPICIF